MNHCVKPSTVSIVQFASKILVTVVGFFATLAFARLLGAEVLGTYFLAVAVLSWLEFLGGLGIVSSIQKRVSEREESDAFLTAGVLLQLGLLVVFGTVLVAFRPLVDAYVGANVGLFLVGMFAVKVLYEALTAGLRGQHRVATAAALALGERSVRAVVQVGLVLLGAGLVGLLVGYIAGVGLAVAALLVLLVLQYRPTVPRRRHFRQLFDYAKFSWLGSLKTRTSAWMDTIVLGFFVSPGLIAVYEVSWNISVVLALASQSIYSTLFPTMSQLGTEGRTDEITDLLETSLVFAGLVAIPGVVGAALLGPMLLRFYGPEFTRGGLVLSILAVTAVISSYEGLVETGLNALDRPDLAFRSNLLFVVTNVIGNVVLVYTFGWVGAAVATAGSVFLSLLYAFYALSQLVQVSPPTGELGRQLLSAAGMGVVVFVVAEMLGGLPYYFVIVPVGVGILTYFIFVIALSALVRKKLFDLADEFALHGS